MLAEEGRSIDYITALFSAAPITVKRRMKLGSASPKLLALLRENAITLDQLATLVLTDGHEMQEQIWLDANEWQRQPNYLLQAITRTEIDASRSRLVRFVGLDAYEGAGGYVRRDLFATTKRPDTLPTRNSCNALPLRSSMPLLKKSGPRDGNGPNSVSSVTC